MKRNRRKIIKSMCNRKISLIYFYKLQLFFIMYLTFAKLHLKIFCNRTKEANTMEPKKYKLDKTDIEIIRNLWDGRTPYSEIALKVGLSTNTVRNKVNRMLEEGALQIISLVDPNAIEGHQSAFIGFKVIPQNVSKVLDQVSFLKGVVGAATVSGRFDIMAVVMFNEEHSYSKFLEEELQKIPGLLSTETFFVVGGKTFQLRYVL